MNISENIRWITEHPEQWALFTNKSYEAKIQRADSSRVYNVPNQVGVVYNFFEDAYEKVSNTGYVVTGVAGEMWPIGESALKKYDIRPEEITDQPQPVRTIPTGMILAGIRISTETEFTLEVDYGEKAVLKGNRPDIDHAEGDYILVAVKEKDHSLVPDFNDSGRIVNGTVFDQLYKPV